MADSQSPSREVLEGDYRLIIDAILDTEIIMLDSQGCILTWSEGAQKLTGYLEHEVVGRHMSMCYADEDIHSGLPERELERAATSGRYEGEGWRTRKDGSRFWANVVLQPMHGRDGTLTGYVKVERDISEQIERERLVQRQRDEILELSTPVIQVWDRMLVLPIIGTLDSVRAARLTESLLQRIASDEAAIVILDISGVPAIDTAVAQHLFKTIQGARLMGAESIISGVRPETAQAMVHLGIDIGRIHSRSTLRDALQLAFRMLASRSSVESTGRPPGVVESVIDITRSEEQVAR